MKRFKKHGVPSISPFQGVPDKDRALACSYGYATYSSDGGLRIGRRPLVANGSGQGSAFVGRGAAAGSDGSSSGRGGRQRCRRGAGGTLRPSRLRGGTGPGPGSRAAGRNRYSIGTRAGKLEPGGGVRLAGRGSDVSRRSARAHAEVPSRLRYAPIGPAGAALRCLFALGGARDTNRARRGRP